LVGDGCAAAAAVVIVALVLSVWKHRLGGRWLLLLRQW
jgi:hypothetical protein